MWPPSPPADSDARHYDAARDELAVSDPFERDFEPVYRHGPIRPPETPESSSAPATPGESAHTPS